MILYKKTYFLIVWDDLILNHYTTDVDNPTDGCLLMVRMIMIDVSLNINVVVDDPNDDLISCFWYWS